MNNSFLDFYHYYFAPIGQPWHHGAVYGNIVAVPICAVISYIVVLRKHVECRQPGCLRFAKVPVTGTHYKTCVKHATVSRHARLRADHAEKHPELHKMLGAK